MYLYQCLVHAVCFWTWYLGCKTSPLGRFGFRGLQGWGPQHLYTHGSLAKSFCLANPAASIPEMDSWIVGGASTTSRHWRISKVGDLSLLAFHGQSKQHGSHSSLQCEGGTIGGSPRFAVGGWGAWASCGVLDEKGANYRSIWIDSMSVTGQLAEVANPR